MADFLKQTYSASLDPETRLKLLEGFREMDVDSSGFLAVPELQSCLAHSIGIQVPLLAARLLARVFTSQGQVSFEQYALLHSFATDCVQGFRERVGGSALLDVDDLGECLRRIRLNISPDTLKALILALDDTHSGRLTLPVYLEVCALCLLSRELFSSLDAQGTGEALIGLEQVVRIALWFV